MEHDAIMHIGNWLILHNGILEAKGKKFLKQATRTQLWWWCEGWISKQVGGAKIETHWDDIKNEWRLSKIEKG